MVLGSLRRCGAPLPSNDASRASPLHLAIYSLLTGCEASGAERCTLAAGRAQAGSVTPRRPLFTQPPLPHDVTKAESFYDSTVEQYARQPLEILSLKQMLAFGRKVGTCSVI